MFKKSEAAEFPYGSWPKALAAIASNPEASDFGIYPHFFTPMK